MRGLQVSPLKRIVGHVARALGHSTAPTSAGGSFSRSLDAATGGRRGNGLGMFGPVNSEIGAAVGLVSSRAAYLAANNAYCANAVANWVAFLVGTGPRPNARALDRDARKLVHGRFDIFWESADHSGRTDLGGLVALMVRDMVVKGEALAVFRDGAEGVQLQVIPPEHLDASKTISFGDGRQVVQGVEFDASGRRLAYWIFPDRPHSIFVDHAPAVRVGAEHVLHMFHPLGPGQVRGLSWLAPAVLPASELDQYQDALLVSAKVAAMHAGFIKDATDTGDEELPLSDPVWEPGAMSRLPLGTDVVFNSPDQVKDAPALLRLNLQALAAAIGVPEHLLSGDLTGANYSSLRAGMIPFRARMEQVQYTTIVPQLLRPIWQRWLSREVLSGAVDVSPMTRADWIMPRPMQVDPLKDIEATERALAAGLTSRTQAVNAFGWNVDDLDEEIAADRARESDLGLGFTNEKGGTDA